MTRHDPSVPSAWEPDPAAPDHGSGVVVLAGALDSESLVALCADVERLLAEGDVQVVVCDVQPYRAADLRLVEVLARLALTARRHDRRFRVRHASWQIRRLLGFAGLADVLPCEGSDSVEVRR